MTGCATHEGAYLSSASVLPATERSMKTAGYWISRQKAPDQVILDAPGIQRLNAHIQDELKLTQDISLIPRIYSGEKLRSELTQQFKAMRRRELFDGQGNVVRVSGKLKKSLDREDGATCLPADSFSTQQAGMANLSPAVRASLPAIYQEIDSNLNLTRISSSIPIRYGLIVRYSDQRVLPTAQGLYEKKFDVDFDELQNSSLDVATPVVILHQSRDGKWLYVVSASSSGWVLNQNIALCPREKLIEFLNPKLFVVTTDSKTDIFLNPELTQFVDYARMGTRFPLEEKIGPDIFAVMLPTRSVDGNAIFQRGYIQMSEAHEGFLPYTQRIMITQAFKLLNAPYGWGGMYGEQDCSAFIQEIFATVGIFFPRNSKEQAQVGNLVARFDKEFSLEEKMLALKTKAVSGITTLGLKGHIMLFLGTIDGHAYAIHATWGYREPSFEGKDLVRILNRVVVSDLSLGEGSKKGSLLERLLTVSTIGE